MAYGYSDIYIWGQRLIIQIIKEQHFIDKTKSNFYLISQYGIQYLPAWKTNCKKEVPFSFGYLATNHTKYQSQHRLVWAAVFI